MITFPFLAVSVVFSQKGCFRITRLVNELEQFHQRWTQAGIQPRNINGSSTWLVYELKPICKQKQGLWDLSQFLLWSSSQDIKCKRDESPRGWQRLVNVLFPSHMIHLIPKYLQDGLSGFFSAGCPKAILHPSKQCTQSNVFLLKKILSWEICLIEAFLLKGGQLHSSKSQSRAQQARPEQNVMHIQVSGTFIQILLNKLTSSILADLLCIFVLHSCL